MRACWHQESLARGCVQSGHSAFHRQCLRIAGVSPAMSHWLHLPARVRAQALPFRFTSTSFGVMRRLAFVPLDNARIRHCFDGISPSHSFRPSLGTTFRPCDEQRLASTSLGATQRRVCWLYLEPGLALCCGWVLPNSLRGRCGGGRIPFGGGWGFPPGQSHTPQDLWEARTRTRALIYGFYPASCYVWAGQLQESRSTLQLSQGFVGLDDGVYFCTCSVHGLS
ncbi:hypothetical protein C8F01DRAFT_261105 [Mycena amicta]|nr:hypothetical protein C8F01DRAFT_261105 [Mycena amicta]